MKIKKSFRYSGRVGVLQSSDKEEGDLLKGSSGSQTMSSSTLSLFSSGRRLLNVKKRKKAASASSSAGPLVLNSTSKSKSAGDAAAAAAADQQVQVEAERLKKCKAAERRLQRIQDQLQDLEEGPQPNLPSSRHSVITLNLGEYISVFEIISLALYHRKSDGDHKRST